jgi:hypothetical protein
MRLEARKYLFDIQDAAGLAAQFTAGKSFADYRADPMLRLALNERFRSSAKLSFSLRGSMLRLQRRSQIMAASLLFGTF